MKNVLICDDDKDILEIVAFILAEDGWETSGSLDCNNIIEKVLNFNPSVILMDNSIPEAGGIQTTHLLKTHPLSSHIPVVFFTANQGIELLARKAGADFYLSKPFDINNLEKVMSQAYEISRLHELRA